MLPPSCDQSSGTLPWILRRGRTRLWLACLVLAALLAAGCGSTGWMSRVGGGEGAPAPRGGPPGPPGLEGWEGRLQRGSPPSTLEAPETLDLAAGWNLVSIPLGRVTGLELGPGVLGVAFAYDAASSSYEVVDLADPASLSSGAGTRRGFWMYASQASQILMTGTPAGPEDSEVTLAAGWNLLGFPEPQARAFSTVRARAAGSSTFRPLPESVHASLAPPGPDTLLFGLAFPYRDGVYEPADLSVPTGVLQPGRAMWVYVHQGGTVLRYGEEPAPPWDKPLSPSSLPPLQLNLDDTARRTWMFADMLRGSEAWLFRYGPNWDSPGYTDEEAAAVAETLQVDAHGFPTAWPAGTRMTYPVGGYETGQAVNPSSQKMEATYMRGVFVLTWKGTGTIYLGYGPNAGRVLLTSPNRIVYQVHSEFGGENVYVRDIDPADPVREVRLWAPAWDGAGLELTEASDLAPGRVAGSLEPAPGEPEPLFHPRYLEHLRQVPGPAALRFMGWMRINWSEEVPHGDDPVAWSDRAHPERGTDSLSVLGNGYNRHPVPAFCGWRTGHPYEWMIDLCNATGKDLWLQVPHTATPDLIENLARLVAERLDPDRRVWFEYSNEIWNSASSYLRQYNQAKALAAEHFGVAVGAVTSEQQAWGSGLAQGRALKLFQDAWRAAGQDDDRLVNVVAGWAISPSYNRKVIEGARELGTDLPEVLAITNYFGEFIQSELCASYPFGSQPGAWPASLFDDMARIQRRTLASLAPNWTRNADLARESGLSLVAYEGGEHMGYFAYGDSSTEAGRDFIAFMKAFKYSPQMASLYEEMYALWSASGGRTASQFVDCGVWSFWGDWGAKEYCHQARTDSVKWNAFCEWGERQAGVRAPGDPLGTAPGLEAATLRGEVGTPFSQDLRATGGQGTVGIELLGGNLPEGVTLVARGSGEALLAGTPGQAGAFDFVLRARDEDGDVSDRAYRFLVDPEGLSTQAMVVFRGADLPVSEQGKGRYDNYNTQLLDQGTRLVLPFLGDQPLYDKDSALQYGFPGERLPPTSPLTMYGGWSVTSVDSAHGYTRFGPPHPQSWTGLRDGQFVAYTGCSGGPSVLETLLVWKASQFAPLGGTGAYRFGSTDSTATLHVDLTSLQLNGSGSDNEVRFVVVNREGGVDRWYLSEAAWTADYVPLDGFNLSGFNNSTTPGRRWAPLATPEGIEFPFPTSGLVFEARDLADVQAVGLFFRGAGYGGTFAFNRFFALGKRE